jgi:hypothetical protein
MPSFGLCVHPGAFGEFDCRLIAAMKHDQQGKALRFVYFGRQVQSVRQVALP